MTFEIPRLDAGQTYFDKDGRPTIAFQIYWQNAMDLIEAEIGSLEAAQAAQAAAVVAQGAAEAAQTAAEAAQLAAENAQTSSDEAAAAQSLSASGTSGCTITATDAGSNATITISAHNRIYGDGSSVAVAGGSIPTLSYSTGYYIYYSDPTRAGGSVTYGASTDPDAAVQSGNNHSVGAVLTPAALGSPVFGSPTLPSGVVDP